MRIHILCSFYDEPIPWLQEMVASTHGLADRIIAVDGRYAMYPSHIDVSPAEQHDAIQDACARLAIGCLLHVPEHAWQGNEVEKRAHMFALALEDSTPDDWFIILDADETIDRAWTDPDVLRERLASTPHDAGHNLLRNRHGSITTRFRSCFRAVPGLTVEGTHYHYVIKQPKRPARYVWHTPHRRYPLQPAVDLHDCLMVHHRPDTEHRPPEREQAREQYYRSRDAHGVERAVRPGQKPR